MAPELRTCTLSSLAWQRPPERSSNCTYTR
nr:MAG TPA: hypothetical protein [Caudoviricetes sp.]